VNKLDSVGLLTGNLKKNQTGMATYAFNIIEGIKDQYQITQIIDKTGDIIEGCGKNIPKTFPFSYNYLTWSLSLSYQKRVFSQFDLVHNMCQYPIKPSHMNRSIITVHDLIPVLFPDLVTPVYAWQSKSLLPRILNKTDRIITVSENTKQDIIKRYQITPDKIDTIYNGVSDHFRPCHPEEVYRFKELNNLIDPYILFVGALEPKKNIPSIIKAYSLCLKIFPKLKLILAGKISWKNQEIFSLIKNLNLEKNVKILNFVDYKDLPLLYAGAEVFVFPSLYEGFGLPPLEAMKCGTPVIVSDRSSLPEIVGEKGLMVNPEDISGLSRMILKVLNEPDFRKNMSDYYIRRADLFTWKRCIQETMESYERTLSG